MPARSKSLLTPALAAAGALAVGAAAHAADPGSCELSAVERGTTPSQRCLSCHDGSAGERVSFQMRADGNGMSHPVAVDYGAVAAAHPERYQPAATLPADVPLVRGRIECTTCHDGASPDPRRVAAVKDLCLACHRL